MLIDVVGGQLFLAHRITGGLSKHNYIRENLGTLFPELLTSKDGTYTPHPIFKGFQIEMDSRGYTTEITMNKIAVRAFSARFDSIEAYKLASHVDYLEENLKRKEKAIKNRVENQYRIKEISFDDMSHEQTQHMFLSLTDAQRTYLISNIPL